MNFTNKDYKKIAMEIAHQDNLSSNISLYDAFFLLISDDKFENLNVLCEKIRLYFNKLGYDYSINDIYKILNSNNLNNELKKAIFEIAENMAYDNIAFGTNVIAIEIKDSKTGEIIGHNKINTSGWYLHSFNVSKACKILARRNNCDPVFAQTYGLLHDIGRKFDQRFVHVVKGFEFLVDKGYDKEAIGCLTHSFVNGGRCANNEPALEGFSVDENGKEQWNTNVKKDDIHLFLDNYEYTPYDKFLSIADLIATNDGIVTVTERLKDIATRRKIDSKNRKYFLVQLINLLSEFVDVDNIVNDLNISQKTFAEITIEEIELILSKVSIEFYNEYFKAKQKTLK